MAFIAGLGGALGVVAAALFVQPSSAADDPAEASAAPVMPMTDFAWDIPKDEMLAGLPAAVETAEGYAFYWHRADGGRTDATLTFIGNRLSTVFLQSFCVDLGAECISTLQEEREAFIRQRHGDPSTTMNGAAATATANMVLSEVFDPDTFETLFWFDGVMNASLLWIHEGEITMVQEMYERDVVSESISNWFSDNWRAAGEELITTPVDDGEQDPGE